MGLQPERVRVALGGPASPKQVGMRNELAKALYKHAQQPKLDRRGRDQRVLPANLVAPHVQLPAGSGTSGRGNGTGVCAGRTAAHDSAYARKQLARGRSLPDVIVGAQVEQLGGHGSIAFPGHDQDWDVRHGAHLAAYLGSVEAGHRQVEQDGVDAIGAEAAQRLVAVVSGHDPMTGTAKQRSQRPDPGGLVVDDEDRQALNRALSVRAVS